AAMVFAISTGLRLARFNVMADDPNKPAWAANFFVGVPAPAGAITVLLPIYVYFLGMPRVVFVAPVALVYTLTIAFLMVSRLPVFSGKRVGKRVAPEMVLPVFVAVVLFFALLISYPWVVLTIGTVCFLASLPVGYLSYRKHERRDAAAASVTPPSARARAHDDAPSLSPGPGEPPPDPHPPGHPARPAPAAQTPARPRPPGAHQLTNVARIERSEIRGSVPHFAALNAGYISFASSFSRSRWTRGSSPRVTHESSARQRMARHQVVGMLPARQRFDAIEPNRDVLVVGGDVEAEFLCRIVEISDQREIGDGRARAEQEGPRREPLVEDGDVVVDASLEEREHGRIARRFGETPQEAIGPEKAVDLLIVEDDPAQRLEPL